MSSRDLKDECLNRLDAIKGREKERSEAARTLLGAEARRAGNNIMNLLPELNYSHIYLRIRSVLPWSGGDDRLNQSFCYEIWLESSPATADLAGALDIARGLVNDGMLIRVISSTSDDPESLDASKSGAVGAAGGAVSIVTFSTALVSVLPAGSCATTLNP